jgi:hypothetical protein
MIVFKWVAAVEDANSQHPTVSNTPHSSAAAQQCKQHTCFIHCSKDEDVSVLPTPISKKARPV